VRSVRALLLSAAWVVVLGSLPVTVSRATGWDADLGLLLTAFAPFGVVSYAIALGLVVLAVWAHRRPRDVVGVLAAVVTTALAALHLAWVAPLVTGDAPEAAAGAEELTVLSVNALKGRADAEVVVDQVREREVDVLVVSEVTPAFVERADAAGLGDLLPRRAGRPGASTEGTMVFAVGRVRVVAQLATTFDSLVVRTSGLTLLAAHPAPPQLPDEWRRDQPLLRDAALRHDVDAVVGDLNATLDHAPIRRLADDGWRDAVELTNGGWAPTWPADGQSGFAVPVVQIDHVLVADRLAVVDVEAFEVPGTDHLAVLATLARA
jgi:endonuclease/exonuclease/phosphatase family metal-dependent hydrolase